MAPRLRARASLKTQIVKVEPSGSIRISNCQSEMRDQHVPEATAGRDDSAPSCRSAWARFRGTVVEGCPNASAGASRIMRSPGGSCDAPAAGILIGCLRSKSRRRIPSRTWPARSRAWSPWSLSACSASELYLSWPRRDEARSRQLVRHRPVTCPHSRGVRCFDGRRFPCWLAALRQGSIGRGQLRRLGPEQRASATSWRLIRRAKAASAQDCCSASV
jgi:hypothetical protein